MKSLVVWTLLICCVCVAGKTMSTSGSSVCLNMTSSGCSSWQFSLSTNDGDSCFTGDDVVIIPGGHRVLMRYLQPGDKVLVSTADGTSLYFDTVFDFLHIDEDPEDTEIIEICVNPNSTTFPLRTTFGCLKVTAMHLLFDNLMQPVLAKDVKIGQGLRHMDGDGIIVPVVVSSVRSYQYLGDVRLSPITHSGTIVVNGILASCYANTKNHWLAHMSMAPLRLYNHFRSFIYGKPRTRRSGYHPYAATLQTVFSRWLEPTHKIQPFGATTSVTTASTSNSASARNRQTMILMQLVQTGTVSVSHKESK